MLQSTRGTIRIGISGWRYDPWRGVFYPKALPQRRELEFASRALPTIEINGSFYSMQRPASYALWHAETPADFMFSVKGPRFITHMLRLRDAETALANFFASGIANLREKLGPFLWQFPPNLQYDATLIENFLALLPATTDDATLMAREHDAKVAGRAQTEYTAGPALCHAIEVRNDSFVNREFVDLLRAYGVALVIAETGKRWPEYEDVTADFVYVRLHGTDQLYVSGYGDDALDHWADRIRAWSTGREPPQARRLGPAAKRVAQRDVFCYFDNTAKREAPRNALRLSRKLGIVRQTAG